MKTLYLAPITLGVLIGLAGCRNESREGGPGAISDERTFTLSVPGGTTNIDRGKKETVTVKIDRGERFDHVGGRGVGGQKQHRQARELRLFAQAPAEIDAAHPRQIPVEHHQIRSRRAQRVEGLLRARDRARPKARRAQHRAGPRPVVRV